MALLKNYANDIVKSRTTPLLIELSKKDLDKLCKDDVCGVNISLALAKELYDKSLKDTTETNIVFIDGDNAKDYEHTYLLEELIELTKDQVENVKNLAIAKEVISAGLSFATGGLLNQLAGGFINNSVDNLVHNLSGDILDMVVNTSLEYIDVGDKITGLIESEVFSFVNDKSIDYLDKIKDEQLYLSKNSKEAIKELSKYFKEEMTPAESFRFILQLMLSIAIDMPTLLFIKNPHKLDNNSLAILSLLFSFSKDVKDSGKHTNLSIVYAYEDKAFQPYQEVEDRYKESKTLLDEQRLFTQRYAMLERPTSNIPHIAVKSSMFVGRQDELINLNKRYNYSKENQATATLETISGEPGIGKTKLVKKHLEQIRKEESKGAKQIQLTLLNQVGHTSSNTGLSSLIDSIVKEASRLESVKTFQENIKDKAKNYAFGVMVEGIKSTLGVDAIIDVGTAIGDKVFLENQIERTKLNTIGDLDNKPQDKKQEQFSRLIDGTKKLLELSDESMPIVLFIDDLQWIDEDSAEYLLENFIKHFNIHIVATIRPSDATTMLKKAYNNKELNPYKVALLNKVDIKIDNEINSDIDTSEIEPNKVKLLGLDTITLTELISKVIEPIDNDDANQKILAKSIIEKFEDKNAKGTANTLFAVETINMLCEEKLYTIQDDNHQIEQLILPGIKPKFNQEVKDFQTVLKNTFEILNKKYQKAFEHVNAEQNENDFNQKFNLMAYAVLEERLNILKNYFAEHGNAAVNTLMFSSLLGTPFNSNIVKNVLEAISTTEEELLHPLKEYILEGEDKITLSEAHYEIIEEVYEILSRYTQFHNSFEYRHSLLNIFLNKQMEYLLNKLFKNIDSFSVLYELILITVRRYKDYKSLLLLDVENLNTFQFQNLIYYKTIEKNIISKGMKKNPLEWYLSYVQNLSFLSQSYTMQHNLKKALSLLESIISILQQYKLGETEKIAETKLIAYIRMINTYIANNICDKAIQCSLDIINQINNSYLELENINFYFSQILNGLSRAYVYNSDYSNAIKVQLEAVEISKKLYIENNKIENKKNYIGSLKNISSIFRRINEYSSAEKYDKIANKIISSDSSQKSLSDMICQGKNYYENGNYQKSIEILKEVKDTVENLYSKNPEVNLKLYFDFMNQLAISYESRNNNNDLQKALNIKIKLVDEGKKYFDNGYGDDANNKYLIALSNLGYSYRLYDFKDKAIELFMLAERVSKKLYEERPNIYGLSYLSFQLNLLAIFPEKEALTYEKKINKTFSKLQNFYDTREILEEYITFLYSLIALYGDLNNKINKRIYAKRLVNLLEQHHNTKHEFYQVCISILEEKIYLNFDDILKITQGIAINNNIPIISLNLLYISFSFVEFIEDAKKVIEQFFGKINTSKDSLSEEMMFIYNYSNNNIPYDDRTKYMIKQLKEKFAEYKICKI